MSDMLFYVSLGILSLILAALGLWIARQSTGLDPVGMLPKKQKKRLTLVETRFIDRKRKLVLVRRDGVEHLMVIGGPVDMIVETGIAVQSAGQNGIEDPLSRASNDKNDRTAITSPSAQNGAATQEDLGSRMETDAPN